MAGFQPAAAIQPHRAAHHKLHRGGPTHTRSGKTHTRSRKRPPRSSRFMIFKAIASAQPPNKYQPIIRATPDPSHSWAPQPQIHFCGPHSRIPLVALSSSHLLTMRRPLRFQDAGGLPLFGPLNFSLRTLRQKSRARHLPESFFSYPLSSDLFPALLLADHALARGPSVSGPSLSVRSVETPRFRRFDRHHDGTSIDTTTALQSAPSPHPAESVAAPIICSEPPWTESALLLSASDGRIAGLRGLFRLVVFNFFNRTFCQGCHPSMRPHRAASNRANCPCVAGLKRLG